MNYNFYFGNVLFEIHSSFEIDWASTDLNFSNPVVPTKRTIHVNVGRGDLFEISGTKVFSSPVVDIYEDQDKEIRFYHNTMSRNKICLAASEYYMNEINIQVHQSWHNYEVSLLMMLHIEKILLEQNGMILHCCYMATDKGAVLFTAPSGTGKTTQANIWHKVYGTDVVNGDRCLIQAYDGDFCANGFFQHGTAVECENIMMPIRAIVIVRQSDYDYIEELSSIQKVALLYSECTVNSWDGLYVNKAFDLLQDLTEQTKVLMLHCTMMDSAAIVLHDYLEKMV